MRIQEAVAKLEEAENIQQQHDTTVRKKNFVHEIGKLGKHRAMETLANIMPNDADRKHVRSLPPHPLMSSASSTLLKHAHLLIADARQQLAVSHKHRQSRSRRAKWLQHQASLHDDDEPSVLALSPHRAMSLTNSELFIDMSPLRNQANASACANANAVIIGADVSMISKHEEEDHDESECF